MQKLNRILLILFYLSLPSVSIAQFLLPNDFSHNFVKYPKAEGLPKINKPGPLANPGRIAASGEYYLVNHIYARAEGFVIEANNVTIDLNGFNIVYACEDYDKAYGIAIPPNYNHKLFFPRGHFAPNGNSKNTVIKDTKGGGSIIKANGLNRWCSAIFGYSSEGLHVENIDIDHSGIDASGIELLYFKGKVSVKNCNISYFYLRDGKPIIDPQRLNLPSDNQSTYYWVTNRHSGWVGNIKIIVANKRLSANIDGNYLIGSPQFGIVLRDAKIDAYKSERDSEFFNHPFDCKYRYSISNNKIELNAKASNCYGLGLSAHKIHAFNNSIKGYGAGITIGGTYIFAHDNVVDVSQGRNFEYSKELWAHGLKMEGDSRNPLPNQCLVYKNKITVKTRDSNDYKDTHFWFKPGIVKKYFGNQGSARALDLSAATGTWNEIRENTFRSIRNGKNKKYSADALRLTIVKKIKKPYTFALIENNIFETNDRFIAFKFWGKSLDWSCIKINKNIYNQLNTNKIAEAKIIHLSTNEPAGVIKIKNPRSVDPSHFLTNPRYAMIDSPSGRLEFSFDTVFCLKAGDHLIINSEQLGTILNKKVATNTKYNHELLYRTIEKKKNVIDTQYKYNIELLNSHTRKTLKNWSPAETNLFCN